MTYRVASLARDPHLLPDRDTPIRFSLAAQQAKFSLSKIAGEWFWSTAETPSTHIFKPSFERHQDADLAEHAMVELAQTLGVPASRSHVVCFRGQRTFLTVRWDRANGICIHAEDLLLPLVTL